MSMNHLLLTAAMLVVLIGCERVPHDDTDPLNGYSGLQPLKDNLTGCEYLLVDRYKHGTALVPRMDANGKQVCRKMGVEYGQ